MMSNTYCFKYMLQTWTWSPQQMHFYVWGIGTAKGIMTLQFTFILGASSLLFGKRSQMKKTNARAVYTCFYWLIWWLFITFTFIWGFYFYVIFYLYLFKQIFYRRRRQDIPRTNNLLGLWVNFCSHHTTCRCAAWCIHQSQTLCFFDCNDLVPAGSISPPPSFKCSASSQVAPLPSW